jgi:PAS domain S-box-containing protein
MLAPSRPRNEEQRLADLHDYGILDTPSEQVFDGIAQLAAAICGTPIAAVTLVDRDRLWFKAEYGSGHGELPRDETFCGHAILEAGLVEIPDAQLDPRFASTEAGASAPAIRFYGGSPLTSDRGNPIGMVCVMDAQPRRLTGPQRAALDQLAVLAMRIIEAGRQSRLASWFGQLLDNVRDEIFIADPVTLRYLHANRAACEHLGYSLDELTQRTPMDITTGPQREDFEAFVRRLNQGERQVTFAGERRSSTGRAYPIEARWQLLQTAGRPVILSIVRDITQQRQLERAKDELIASLSRELELARTLQMSLLPQPGRIAGLEAIWMLQPSSYVGGDTFDYLELGGRLCFFMIDVAGHGVPAAMLAHSAQHQLYDIARQQGTRLLSQGRGIDEAARAVVAEFNDRMCALTGTDMYLTLLFGIADTRGHEVVFVQCGHPAMLLAGPGSDRFEPCGDGGLPIGVLKDAPHEVVRIAFPPGARLLVHSDGLTECMDPAGLQFGSERLQALLARSTADGPQRLLDDVRAGLVGWRGAETFDDDVALLLLSHR